MKEEKDEKKAPAEHSLLRTYLTSLLSLALCTVMFMGTTIAWFTDEVGSTGNKITAGEFNSNFSTQASSYANSGDGNSTIFDGDAKWIPGQVVAVPLSVSNSGDIPFTYVLGMSLQDGDGNHLPEEDASEQAANSEDHFNPYDLAQYFDIYISEEPNWGDENSDLTIDMIKADGSGWTGVGNLANILRGIFMYDSSHRLNTEVYPSDTVEPDTENIIWLAVYMNPSVPSDFINKSIENIYIYMKSCQKIEGIVTPVVVANKEELVNALETNESIVLSQDIYVGQDVLVISQDKTVTLNMNGKTLSGDGEKIFEIYGNLTLESGNVEYLGVGNLAVVKSGGILTINSGNYIGSNTETVFAVEEGGTLQHNSGNIVNKNDANQSN